MSRVRFHFLVFLILWVVFGYLDDGIQWFVNFYLFLTFQAINGPIYPVTMAMAWATFLIILYRHRQRGIDGFLIAGSAPFGGAALYEIAQDTAGLFHGWSFDPLGSLDLMIWIGLGLTGLYHWQRKRSTALLFVAFCSLFGAWSLIGYPQVGLMPLNPVAYAFNVTLKVLAFLIFLYPLA